MGTMITGLILLGIVAAVVIKIYRDKKKNKCAGCSCGCRNYDDRS
ncbi:MAG: FeoB-associated Cys-rich membrane protein [Treponema sp.]|jgi:hypothetical protein|nr:FeoB-associated Cys-rich membrane protein [Treponema sp.]